MESLLENSQTRVNEKDREGNTALLIAAKKGYHEILQMLSKRSDIQINEKDTRGDTALLVAVKA